MGLVSVRVERDRRMVGRVLSWVQERVRDRVGLHGGSLDLFFFDLFVLCMRHDVACFASSLPVAEEGYFRD
jgi:hypothetical protein